VVVSDADPEGGNGEAWASGTASIAATTAETPRVRLVKRRVMECTQGYAWNVPLTVARV
jgi:hypothetical protein